MEGGKVKVQLGPKAPPLPMQSQMGMGNLWKELEADNIRLHEENERLQRDIEEVKALNTKATLQRASDLSFIQQLEIALDQERERVKELMDTGVSQTAAIQKLTLNVEGLRDQTRTQQRALEVLKGRTEEVLRDKQNALLQAESKDQEMKTMRRDLHNALERCVAAQTRLETSEEALSKAQERERVLQQALKSKDTVTAKVTTERRRLLQVIALVRDAIKERGMLMGGTGSGMSGGARFQKEMLDLLNEEKILSGAALQQVTANKGNTYRDSRRRSLDKQVTTTTTTTTTASSSPSVVEEPLFEREEGPLAGDIEGLDGGDDDEEEGMRERDDNYEGDNEASKNTPRGVTKARPHSAHIATTTSPRKPRPRRDAETNKFSSSSTSSSTSSPSQVNSGRKPRPVSSNHSPEVPMVASKLSAKARISQLQSHIVALEATIQKLRAKNMNLTNRFRAAVETKNKALQELRLIRGEVDLASFSSLPSSLRHTAIISSAASRDINLDGDDDDQVDDSNDNDDDDVSKVEGETSNTRPSRGSDSARGSRLSVTPRGTTSTSGVTNNNRSNISSATSSTGGSSSASHTGSTTTGASLPLRAKVMPKTEAVLRRTPTDRQGKVERQGDRDDDHNDNDPIENTPEKAGGEGGGLTRAGTVQARGKKEQGDKGVKTLGGIRVNPINNNPEVGNDGEGEGDDGSNSNSSSAKEKWSVPQLLIHDKENLQRLLNGTDLSGRGTSERRGGDISHRVLSRRYEVETGNRQPNLGMNIKTPREASPRKVVVTRHATPVINPPSSVSSTTSSSSSSSSLTGAGVSSFDDGLIPQFDDEMMSLVDAAVMRGNQHRQQLLQQQQRQPQPQQHYNKYGMTYDETPRSHPDMTPRDDGEHVRREYTLRHMLKQLTTETETLTTNVTASNNSARGRGNTSYGGLSARLGKNMDTT